MSTFTLIPFSRFEEQGFQLNPQDYRIFEIKNQTTEDVSSLITFMKKGQEVGGEAYLSSSNKYFLRSGSLRENFFTVDKGEKSAVPIIPSSFINQNLKKGMILISKDANVGETSYLEEDYPDHMLAGGIIGFRCSYPFYVLAFLKNKFIKEQLDSLAPSHGATLAHARETFLDCKIPFPNNQQTETIDFVSELNKAILRREIQIQENYEKINEEYEKELFGGQNNQQKYSTSPPRFSEIVESRFRLDSGLYNNEFKACMFILKNYSRGFFTVSKEYFRTGTTNDCKIGIGTAKWVAATHFDHFGYLIIKENVLRLEARYNITKNCAIFKNRTNKELLGEHVGTGFFYNYQNKGIGHHHQGCYRVTDLPNIHNSVFQVLDYRTRDISERLDMDLKFMVVCLNTRFYRKICGFMSLGSKMPELKLEQFSNIPFIKIDESNKRELVKLYDNEPGPFDPIILQTRNLLGTPLSQTGFENFDNQNLKDFGILQLAEQIEYFKKILDYCVTQIRNDEVIQEYNLENIRLSLLQ